MVGVIAGYILLGAITVILAVCAIGPMMDRRKRP